MNKEKMKRDVILKTRLTIEEYAELKRFSEKHRISMSSVTRSGIEAFFQLYNECNTKYGFSAERIARYFEKELEKKLNA